MADKENKISLITDEEVYRMKNNSIRFMVNSPSAKGYSPQQIKDRLVNCILGDKDSILFYLRRFLQEQDVLNDKLVKKYLENIIIDKELNDNSANPVENQVITKAIMSLRNRIDQLPDSFTYNSTTDFLDHIFLEVDEENQVTRIAKIVRGNGVEYLYKDLIIGTSFYIRSQGPDYWLAVKEINTVFAEDADINNIKMQFFEISGGDDIDNITEEELENIFKTVKNKVDILG